MITPETAQRLVLSNSFRKRIPPVVLNNALGYVLAQDVISPVDLPHWDNSAMDGFAMRSKDTALASEKNPVYLEIAGSVQAGDGRQHIVRMGQAMRIMTGAKIPHNADTILIKEDAVIRNNRLEIRTPIREGKHVRKKGEEIRRGQSLALTGKILNPGLIGFLASLGKKTVSVYAKPTVGIISTGNELIAPGRRLETGKIYDSNSVMLDAALKEISIRPGIIKTVPDDPIQLRKAISQALRKCDTVILTGGVSAGDYDYCREILSNLRVRTVFWKVNQKPGKPLFFGRRKDRLVFGLPGNPASVHMCFYEYVVPSILHKMGITQPLLPRETGVATVPIRRDTKKTLFLKARLTNRSGHNCIEILSKQASHMISTLYRVNGFAVIPSGSREIKKGEPVLFDRLPVGGGCT